MRNILSIAIVFLAMSTTIFGQDSFEQWKKKEKERYQTYKNKRAEEWDNFKKAYWKKFESMKSGKLYEKPKPKKIPEASPVMVDVAPQEIKAEIPPIPKIKKQVTSEPKPPKKPIKKDKLAKTKKPKIKGTKKLEFDFYGMKAEISHSPIKIERLKKINKKDIKKYVETLSKNKELNENILSHINDYVENWNMDGWALYNFLIKFSNKLTSDSNTATMLAWYILLEEGYRVKLAYSETKTPDVYLLIGSETEIYNSPYIDYKEGRYYFIFPNRKTKINSKSFISFENEKSNNSKNLDLLSKDFISLAGEYDKLTLDKKSDEKLDIWYNKDNAQLMSQLPCVGYDKFFNTKSSDTLLNSLSKILKEKIKGKSEEEAVNILLTFTQSLPYKTDAEQFGYEKTMTPEEIFYYPYSDCEDRAILFAYLVKNLLDLPVIGLQYPNHMTSAVAFSSDLDKGFSVKYKEKKYTLTEATGPGHKAGMMYKKHQKLTPKIVD